MSLKSEREKAANEACATIVGNEPHRICKTDYCRSCEELIELQRAAEKRAMERLLKLCEESNEELGAVGTMRMLLSGIDINPLLDEDDEA